MEMIRPLLNDFEKVSELMSAENKQTICWLAFRAKFLKEKFIKFLETHPIPKVSKDGVPVPVKVLVPGEIAGNKKNINCHKLALTMYNDLVQRFPQNLTQNYIIATTSILNPALKGFLVKESGNLDTALARIILAEEGAAEVTVAANMNDAVVDSDDEDAMMIAELTQRQTVETVIPTESPMSKELALYMSLLLAKASADVLEYWHVNEHPFPLLARVVKKYFCIQASSSSCERTFSTSGNIVTPKRNKLDPKNVHMLVYLMANLGKVELPKQPAKVEDKKKAEDKEKAAADEADDDVLATPLDA